MSERKVINKYIPPDFDPNKSTRRKGGGGGQKSVRLMAPYSMRCNRCGEFIYRGKKFNARKEVVRDQDYYGIKIFRFYIKCPRCSSEITFKTDPKNTDYAAEHGATRNFEPWHDDDAKQGDAKLIVDDKVEEELDPMKALEKRQTETQREMEIHDALQDIRTRNARLERVDPDTVLEQVGQKRKALQDSVPVQRAEEEEQDEELVRRFFPKEHVQKPPTELNNDEVVPDATSLLNDTTRHQLQAMAKPKPTPRKRRGPNALGLVRK
ncbi:Pre-mRNA-splicing factor cwf16 [Malassezia vespertilionis]|uniref:Splicing factor YJU2 n=1 Tax=Malassezia vespertilionis TaxID=2020962 RepID=A0A2N1J9S6_9BASI|nr:Pre-mRNA-splicing factor cwf16 [Malassezia vespertilionis]PKI83301.1 hypothetical protein MVES_002796 [Malassezia vespertilionis]WFD07580.1 Pre-mRNA-splicing factor cwf16 [Malassezia vespertilionis]